MKRTKRNGWKRTKHDPHLKTFLIVFTALVGIVLLVSGLSLTISSQENSFTYNIIQNSIREISDQLTGFAVSIPQGQGIGINGTIEEMINKTSTIDETPAIDKTITTPDKIVEPQLIQSADTSGGQLGILAAPTINSIILNTTNPSTNDTAQNLTVNVTTSDIDGDPVKVIYNWYKDGTSIAVLNMPFENNTVNVSNSTKDYSGYGNNGTVTGAVWNATGGYDGKGAYQFNSSGDYITVPNINLNASNNDFSVFLWAKIGQHDLYKKIIHKKGSFEIFFAAISGGGVSCRLINTTNQFNVVTTGMNVWPDTNWHFVGCEFLSNNSVNIYVDGSLVKSGTFAGTHNVTDNNIMISDNSAVFFNGTIDDVMIFNRSLSLEQVLALYNNRTDLIVSQETSVGDVWNVSATPNDGSQDGTTWTSNSVTILNAKPTQSTPILNSTDPTTNNSLQNLTAYNQSTADIDGDSVKNIYNWYKDGTSISILNMPFEGINGTTSNNAWDYSGYENNGSVTGATWNSTGGYDGKGAYEFDGSNDVINLSSAAAQTTSVTYMAWLKPADAGWRRIFNNASLSDLGWYTNSQVVKRYDCSIESTAGSVPTDQWTHFAYTYDGSTSRIYINGLLDVSNSNDCRELGGIKYIGKDDGVEDFSGSIDEVMIFNRSLSAEQILALYNNRTDLIVSQETFPGDVWNVSITPNDGNDDGTMLTSNSVLIQDTATPSITVQSPTNNSQLLSVVNLTFSVGDDAGVDQCWYSLDDGANTTLSGCANTSITPGGGIHNITFYVNDTSNNINSSGLINFSVNYLPTIDSLILNSTNPANNDTNQNLTAYSTTSDTDGGSVKVIYNWLVNGTSQLLFNVPLEPSLDLLNGTDYSGFGINANGIIGSPYFNSTGGHDGKGAYQFNASPPSAISFNAANFPAIGTGNYTFEAWVKTNSSKSYQAIWVAKNSGGSYLLSFYIYNNAGSSGLAVINGGSGRYSDVNNNLLDNNWHHVAFVREGNGTNQLKFYIDSIHYGSKTDSFSQPAPASIFVGWTNNTSPPTYDFNGTIDEVRLWNRSLSVEQILAIYNNRTDLIVSNETKIGENWTVQGTPNDGKEDGVTLNSNSLIITVPDTTSPTFSNPSNTSLNFRRYQNFTANITIDDETALDYYIFSTNSSGSWVNTSARDISGNAQHNASEQANISIAQGSPVCWLYYANDTSGNMNNSDTYCFTVANSIPTHSTPILNSTNPITNDTNQNLTAYNQSTIDIDGDSVKNIYNWKVNGTSIAVLNMPFEGINGTTSNNAWDYSGFGNNGSETGGVTWNSTSGYDGKGTYQFDGVNDYIDVSSLDAYPNGKGQLSISVWVKYNISLNNKAVVGWWWNKNNVIKIVNNKLVYAVDADSSVQANSDNELSDNNWHHIVGIYDKNGGSNNVLMYIDGVLQITKGTTTGNIQTADKFDIGTVNDVGSGAYNFNGSIDDVIIFNRTLSAEQILALYNNRTDLIVSQETSAGEVWNVSITPNDGSDDGTMLTSNSVTILNAKPTQLTPILNSTDPTTNNTLQNLTAYNQSTADVDGDSIKNIYNWYKDGTSIAVLNMPFEANDGSESTTTKDYSLFGNDGIVTGGAIWNPTGGYDDKGAYFFNKSNKITTTVPSNPYQSMSISLWIKPMYENLATNCTQSGAGLFCGVAGSASNFLLELAANQAISIYLYDINTPAWQFTSATGTITNNAWQHIGITYWSDGTIGNITLYVNGIVKSSSQTAGLNGTINFENLMITELDLGRPFNGIIDEVMIFNRTLSAEQIIAFYNNRTDLIVLQETSKGEVWNVSVTPNDGTEDGNTLTSNSVTILNTEPTHSTPILNSTDPTTNYTNQNLTAYNQSTADTDGDSVKNIYNWKINGTSITILNMPFEGINGTTSNNAWDYSGYGNNGSETGAIWNATGGYDGKGAYEFDGDTDKIIVSDSDELDFNGTNTRFTITFWAKHHCPNSAVCSGSLYDAMLSKGTSCDDNYIFYMGGNSYPVFAVYNGSGCGGSTIIQGSAWKNNTWMFVTGQYNGTHIVYYENGVKYGSTAMTKVLYANAQPIKIGGSSTALNSWNGSIDDVMIFNRTLSNEEIIAIYNNRTDLIVSQETSVGDNWSVEITPNDGTDDGQMLESNGVIIQAVPDTTSPTFSSPSNTSYNFRRYENFTANITIDDETSLDSYIFSTNASGSWANTSARDISGNAQYNASEQTNISLVKNNQICWYYWANDSSSNNASSTTYCFIVQNTAPTFNESLTSQDAYSSIEFNYYINCSDLDGDNIIYYDNTSLFAINSTTGLINDTPLEAEVGTYSINISCSDGEVNTSETFTYTINDLNAPSFSNPINTSLNFRRYENFTANITLDDGVALDSYNFSTNASGSWVNINRDILETQYNASEQANISLAKNNQICWYYWANDTTGNEATWLTYCFTVQNTPPIFNESLTNQNAYSDQEFNYDINCSDIDGDNIIYYDNTSLFAINSTTGFINDTPTQFEAGVYSINISCSDGQVNSSQTFQYTIHDSTAPTFSNAINTSLNFSRYQNFTANITINNTNLSTYIFSTNASGSWANTSARDISGNAQYNTSEQANITLAKNNQICWYYWANDSSNNNATSTTYCFTVQNTPPSFNESLTSQDAYSGGYIEFNYDINCSDIDDDSITYYDNTTLFNINSTTGFINDSPSESEVGVYDINITCSDGEVNTSETFTYTINDLNAPSFSNPINTSLNFRRYENFTANITLDDGVGLDSYNFSTNASGSWVNINRDILETQYNASEQANISLAKNNQICWYYWANDTTGNEATWLTYCFTVQNSPPAFNQSLTDQNAYSSIEFNYDINCSDIDGDIITYYDNTSLFAINSTTGFINDTPTQAEAGVYSINISCSDGEVNTSQTFQYTIHDSTAPTFSNAINTSLNFSRYQNFTANITINNTNLSTYIFSTNASGSWANTSARDISGNAQYNASEQANISLAKNNQICWYYWVNDTSSNNATSTTYCFTIVNTIPTHSTPILNSTNPATNNTNQNLTAYNQSTSDIDGDTVKNIYNWKVNETSIAVLNIPFEGINGTTTNNAWDYSGYENNGTVTGAVWNATGGYDGKGAYQFNSSGDYITVPNINLNASNNDFSVFLWAKIGQHDLYKKIIHKKGSFEIFFAAISGGGVSCRLINTTNQFNVVTTGMNVWPDTNWHFVGCEFLSNNSVNIYVDGSLVKSGTFAGTHNVTDNNIMISDNSAVFFNGTIDDVMIFNRSLSLEQVLALYNNRTDLIVSQETSAGDNWSVEITPNDGSEDGVMLESNSVIIQAVPDTTSPTFSNPLNTSLNFSRYQNFTANITIDDETSLDSYIFSTNASGSWSNTSARDILGAQYNASKQANITLAKNNQICWYYWANDTSSNNATSTTYCFTVQNTPPAQSNTLAAVSLTNGDSTTINLSQYFTDVDDDKINYTTVNVSVATISINNTNKILTITATSVGSGSTYVNASDGTSTTQSSNFTITVSAAASPPSGGGGGVRLAQCNDDSDNDGDGLIDYPDDPGCESSNDNDEFNIVILKVCLESWTCLEWSECIEGKQVRRCYDENVCGTSDYKPSEDKACYVAAASVEEIREGAKEVPVKARIEMPKAPGEITLFQKIVNYFEEFFVFWPITLMIILIFVIVHYIREIIVQEKILSQQKTKLRVEGSVVGPPKIIEATEKQPYKWGKKEYLNLEDELKRVDKLLKEDSLPAGLTKSLEQTSTKKKTPELLSKKLKSSLKQTSIGKDALNIGSLDNLEQWMEKMLTFNTPKSKVEEISRKLTNFTDDEITLAFSRAKATKTLQEIYSLDKDKLLELKKFIQKGAKKGLTTKQIIFDLTSEGWSKEAVGPYVIAYYQ